MDANPKTQITDKLNKATNVLVTVSTNPSVDQLASAIGLTLVLNKLGKHATAVFSGDTPSTIEFLQPEKTLEKTTDSLRDFIISLDKSKADKLRYKVEDQMVKIFITPYKTSITDKDLEFSQGDFNVDVVIAVGVNEPKDLDQAITAHGRILHDATVVSINTHEGASVGSINWVQTGASSLSEMLLDVSLGLKEDILDGQMATAFLTGIVAETDRFSNEKTSSSAMQLSAKLMAAGANQQLVASQLQPKVVDIPKDDSSNTPKEPDAELPEVAEPTTTSVAPPAEPVETKPAKPDNGALHIDHGHKKPLLDLNDVTDSDEPEEDQLEQINIDNDGILKSLAEIEAQKQEATEESASAPSNDLNGPKIMTQPPILGGTLTANSTTEGLDPSLDPLGVSANQSPLLSHDSPSADNPLNTPINGVPTPTAQDIIGATPQNAFVPVSPAPVDNPNPVQLDEASQPKDTLSDLEKVVDSPHLAQQPEPNVSPAPEITSVPDGLDAARDAVLNAVSGTPQQIVEPIQSLNSQPMDLNLGDMPAVATSPASAFMGSNNMINPSLATPTAFPDPYIANNGNTSPGLTPPAPGLPADNTAGSVSDPTAPPPVPPPMMPPVPPAP